jgi:hypothetical protein
MAHFAPRGSAPVHAPYLVISVLNLEDVGTIRVNSYAFIAQQVVENNMYELTYGGGSCEV